MEILTFLTISTAVILLLTTTTISLLYFYKKRRILYMARVDAIKLDHEKNLLSAQVEIQEETLRHISREIHDNINLSLTLAKLYLNSINWSDLGRTHIQVDSSISLLSESIGKLSRLSKDLHPNDLNQQGLIPALENELEKLKNARLFDVHLRILGEPKFLSDQQELLLFRIFQESLNNIIKHSSATNVDICLHFLPSQLLICILDNGIGFELNVLDSHRLFGHSGLSNMASRAKSLGGAMQVETAIRRGTKLLFNIPI